MSLIDQGLKDALKKANPQLLKGGSADGIEAMPWQPSDEEKQVRQMVMDRFSLGYTTMYVPRVEFNDLSTIARQQIDTMAFNTYQPNNGDPWEGDEVNGWRSNAIRPVERNKAISIAAHATARTIFPKVFASDEGSNPQEAAAHVIRDLMEWTGEKYGYEWTALRAVIQALYEPVSVVHTEYVQTYRDVKRPKEGGGYKVEKMLDEDLSGFRDTIVPTDQIFIENFFEPDIQKQGWLIWRRVQDYRLMAAKYGHLPNFKHVKPGVQVMFNDANGTFYWVYDPTMRQYQCEEVLYYEKASDLFLVFVNGVLLTAHDNPNPRWDKLYPFTSFGYEFIKAANCFYYKSLVFRISHDANIINTLYPMIIDGTYLNLMPPMMAAGGEIIGSDVIVPGLTTTFSNPDAKLQPVKMNSDVKSGLETMFKVEESVNQSSEIPVSPDRKGTPTAYEISKREQERNETLGLFVQMIGNFVKQYGRLRIGDILQHLTVADADKITDEPDLVYKSFLINKKDAGNKKFRKIQFAPLDAEADETDLSYETLEMQGGIDSDTELYRTDPERIRDLNYMLVVSPDVLNPRSEEVERMYMLEAYDRAILNPTLDPEQVTKDFLLAAYPRSARDPDKYVRKVAGAPMIDGMAPPALGGQAPAQPMGPQAAMQAQGAQPKPAAPAFSR